MDHFEPEAEEKSVRLTLAITAGLPAMQGDRDLCFKALSTFFDDALNSMPR